MKGALRPVVEKYFAAITDPKEVAGLLRALDSYMGGVIVTHALRLTPFVFVRPGELRTAEWAEMDLEAEVWEIPASKMKMRVAHIVPLSRQALEILRGVEPFTRLSLDTQSETLTLTLRQAYWEGFVG
jgi:integrase